MKSQNSSQNKRKYLIPVVIILCILAGYIYNSPTYYYDKTYLIDLTEKKIIASIYEPHISQVTSDLNYFLLGSPRKLYKYDETSGIVKLLDIESSDKFCFSNSNNYFITTDNNKIRVYNLEDLNIIQEYNIETDLYDPIISENNLLGTYDVANQIYQIYDLNNGDMIKEIKTIKKSTGTYWFMANKLFSKSGYYIPVDFEN